MARPAMDAQRALAAQVQIGMHELRHERHRQQPFLPVEVHGGAVLAARLLTAPIAKHVLSAAKRQQLKAALEFMRDGDALSVAKPDRLARSDHPASTAISQWQLMQPETDRQRRNWPRLQHRRGAPVEGNRRQPLWR